MTTENDNLTPRDHAIIAAVARLETDAARRHSLLAEVADACATGPSGTVRADLSPELRRCSICGSPMYADQERCGLCAWFALPPAL